MTRPRSVFEVPPRRIHHPLVIYIFTTDAPRARDGELDAGVELGAEVAYYVAPQAPERRCPWVRCLVRDGFCSQVEEEARDHDDGDSIWEKRVPLSVVMDVQYLCDGEKGVRTYD